MRQKRNYALDVIKLLLAYVIAFHHLGYTLPPTPEVAVVIFFTISGFFLGKKFYSRSLDDPERYTAWDYTWDHIIAVYPHYIFSAAVLFLYITLRNLVALAVSPSLAQVKDIVQSFYMQIPDILLLQSSYRFHESMNYPAWQISALLIGGYFVYALLCCSEKHSRRLIFPALILMVQSIIHTEEDLFINWGPLYLPILRAMSGLSVGVLTWYFVQSGKATLLDQHPTAVNLLSLFCIICLLLYCDLSGVYLLTVPFLIVALQSEHSWIRRLFDHSIFRKAGSLSLAVYLNHALIERIVKALLVPRLHLSAAQTIILYFFLTTGYSVFTMMLVEKWTAPKKDKIM